MTHEERLYLRLRRAALGIQAREFAKRNRAECAVRAIAGAMVEREAQTSERREERAVA